MIKLILHKKMKKQNEIEEKEDINNNSKNRIESVNLFMNQMKKEIEN